MRSSGWKALRRLGRRGLVEFAGKTLTSCRDWTAETFEDERVHGLFAPWVLHAGLGPDAASSGFMAQVIGVAIELGGMPVPRGGGVKLVEALRGIVEDAGGALRDGPRGRERGRRSRPGDRRPHRRRRGDRGDACRAGERDAAAALRAAPRRRGAGGRGGAPVPLRARRDADPLRALGAAAWQGDARLGRTAIVHLTPGLDGVSRAVNEADRGLLPAEATVVVGQPMAVDPSRAPEGSWILWIQLQELPSRPKGDAAGELDTGRGWTKKLSEAYADRIQARIAHHAPNFERSILKRVVHSPADQEAANPNFVGGDIYSGSCALDQNLIWRPAAGTAGSPDERRALVAHRREHPPGAGARGGVGISRGKGAVEMIHELRLVVTADDYDEAVAFYRDVLGMRQLEFWTSPTAGKVVLLDAGRATLEISDAKNSAWVDEVEVGRRVGAHIRVALEVDDSRAMTTAAVEAGAELVAGPTETPGSR